MSLSQHAILHRKSANRTRLRGQMIEGKPTYELIRHCFVAPLSSENINRTLEGTRKESKLKVILFGAEKLTIQDQIELEGDLNSPGTGILYEIIEVEYDMNKMAGHVSYIVRRKQDQPT